MTVTKTGSIVRAREHCPEVGSVLLNGLSGAAPYKTKYDPARAWWICVWNHFF